MNNPTNIPQHIAIIMDGNGRWAKKRFLPRVAGHKVGVDALRDCVEYADSLGVKVLTVFAFSSENWNRPIEEVSGIMELMITALARELRKLKEKNARLYFVGERSHLSDKVRAAMEDAEVQTAQCTGIIFNVCLNYGGRWDMVQAAQKVVAQGLELTADNVSKYMALAHVSDPDLLIRTGGEYRISNFLLWQCAYSEMYFTDTLWPAFKSKDLDEAIAAYNNRERRFGKTSEQVSS